MVFDKTGTLFTRIEEIEEAKIVTEKYNENELWQIISLMEKGNKHPLALVLYKEALSRIDGV